MLVSLTSTTTDATDLGYLLHKHPDRVRSVDLKFGQGHVFYPVSNPERCTATLLVEVDPIKLTRSGKRRQPAGLEPYVNDRPYAASSMLSVALGRLFSSALNGTCEPRPELVDKQLDLQVEVPVVPVRGGTELLGRLFEPLGYAVDAEPIALDESRPDWGLSQYLSVTLSGKHTVQAALAHLVVMLPVLDDRKHYWIGEDEIDKLMRRGGDWLATHPDSELIARRYLRFAGLAREALARLSEGDEEADTPEEQVEPDGKVEGAEQGGEQPLSLGEQRLRAVLEAVRSAGGGRVVDLGCGEGRLLRCLLDEKSVTYTLGVDVSIAALERAERRLCLDQLSERRRDQISLIQGALTYTDQRIRGFDVATVIEVVEHLDPPRLDVFAHVLFGDAAPSTVVLTTPNREHNENFDRLGPTGLRHDDHRFEWTRAEFAAWTESIQERYGYRCEITGIGADDPVHGPPTQIGVFRR